MKLDTNIIRINGYKSSSRYTLMHKDISLIDIDEDKGVFDVHDNNKDLLPYALRRSNLNYNHFYNWASLRSLLLDRKNSKLLLNTCNLPQDDKFEISKACKLISIEDCFWIREGDEEWENVNLRENSLSKAISQIALNGESITITGDISTPEFTTQGYSPKAWVREEDGLYLYKKSTDRYESEKEVLANDILEALGIPHIVYGMQADKICKCKCMTNEKYSRLTFREYATYAKNNGMNPLTLINEKFSLYFFRMAAIDYVLANTDRHPGNWGFYVSNDTGQIIAPHPLFDHNLAFDEISFNPESRYIPAPAFTYVDLARAAINEYGLDLSRFYSIPESRFEEISISYKMIDRRIREIQPVYSNKRPSIVQHIKELEAARQRNLSDSTSKSVSNDIFRDR